MLETDSICCGDNLIVLKEFDDDSVDLVYIDPQFFTRKVQEVIVKDGVEVLKFDDQWLESGPGIEQGLKSYLEWMEPRLRELHRVLKKTGSFFLHVDHHADAYLKVICDKIFGYGNLVNVITWKRTDAKGSGVRMMNNVTDTIFFYSKSREYTYNPQPSSSITNRQLKDYKKDKKTGRYYKLNDLTSPGNGNRFEWRGILPKARSWKFNKDKLEALLAAGLIKTDENGRPLQCGHIQWFDDIPSKDIDNLWLDIPRIGNTSEERLDYPTQKPEALLRRIILMASKEGDIILDAFCGSGTTLKVSKDNRRNFIGIDVSPTACLISASRLGIPVSGIEGLIFDEEHVMGMDDNDFQNAVARLIDPHLSTISIDERGPGGSLDGKYHDLSFFAKKSILGSGDILARSKNGRYPKNPILFIAPGYDETFENKMKEINESSKRIIHFITISSLLDGKHEKLIIEENQRHGKLI